MSNQKYQPLEDRVLVRLKKQAEPEKTAGGIILADTVKKEVMEGFVFSVGQGRYAGDSGTFMPTVLAKGDTVLFGANQGLTLAVPNDEGQMEDMRLMREGDVLLLISRADTASE